MIDNHHFGETGMQTSHTGQGIDLAKVAAACGSPKLRRSAAWDEVAMLSARLGRPAEGPRLHVIKVVAENPPRSVPSRDAVYIKNRFRAHLGFPPG